MSAKRGKPVLGQLLKSVMYMHVEFEGNNYKSFTKYEGANINLSLDLKLQS